MCLANSKEVYEQVYLNLENITPVQKLMGFPDLNVNLGFFVKKYFNGLRLKQDFPVKWT